MDIKRLTTIDDSELDYLIEYLSLPLDIECNIIDKKYPKEIGYKVYGHIATIIEQLENCKKNKT